MKKVALYVISDGIGGAELVIWQTLNSFRGNSDIYLIINNEIASYYSELLPKENILNIGYIYFNSRFKLIRFFINNRFFSFKNKIVNTKSRIIKSFIIKNNIRILHTHLDYALYSAITIKKRIQRLKIIHTVHGVFGLITDQVLKPDVPFSDIDFKLIDTLVFVSKYVYQLYLEHKIYINDYNIIYNGVEIPNTIKLKKERDNNHIFTILYLGGSKYVKGYDILVETISFLIDKYKDIRFKVLTLGQISSDCELIKLINRNKLNSFFEIIGFVSPPAHLDYFIQSDLLFMPSRSEALPIAAIEAVFLNLPIVASEIGGLPEIIQNGMNGFLCPINADRFANSILYIKYNYESFLNETKMYNNVHKLLFKTERMKEQLLKCYI